MIVYIVFVLLFFCSSFLEIGGLKKSQAQGLLGFLAVILILFVGLRYNTGGDWFLYKKIFNNSLSAKGNFMNIESGYLLLNKIIKYTFNNYYVLQFTVTLFVVTAFYKLYKNNSQYPIVSFSLLTWIIFYSILTSQMRQSIAIAIIVYSTQYIFDRKHWKFILAIVIASFFHISAVLAIPLYFLYKNYGKVLPITLMVASQILYFHPEIIKAIVLFIAPYLPARLSGLAEGYISSYFNKKTEFGTGLFYIGQMLLSVFTVLTIKPKDNKQTFFLNTLAVFIIIKGFSIGFEIIGRLEPYYLVYAIVAYTYLFSIELKKVSYWIIACFLLVYFAAPFVQGFTRKDTFVLTGRPANYTLVPYYNVLIHPTEAESRKDWSQK